MINFVAVYEIDTQSIYIIKLSEESKRLATEYENFDDFAEEQLHLDPLKHHWNKLNNLEITEI